MDFLLGMGGILRRQKAAHYLPDNHGRGLEYLAVVSIVAADGKMGAELVLYGAADLVA